MLAFEVTFGYFIKSLLVLTEPECATVEALVRIALVFYNYIPLSQARDPQLL